MEGGTKHISYGAARPAVHRETHLGGKHYAAVFLGLMAGCIFGVAIMCLMQMARKHDDK